MSAFLTPLVIFVPAYYAGALGLGLSAVGTIFGLSKLWDIVTDPILGSVMDRFGPGTNRRRFWMILSIPIMLVGIFRIFLPDEGVNATYFALWMMFLYVGWTILQISHISWGIEISEDYYERSRIAAYRQLATLIGSLVIILIPILIDRFGPLDESARIGAMGLFLMVSLPLLTPLVIWSHKEGAFHRPSQETAARSSPLDFYRVIRDSPSFRAVLVANMAMLIGISATMSTLLFYVESSLRLGGWATFSIVPLCFSGILFLPVWRHISDRIGKHRAYRASLLVQCALLPLFLIIPPENLLLTLVAFTLLGANQGTVVFLPQAMLADITDNDLRTGYRRRTGLYVSILQSTSKLSSALAVAVMFFTLSLIGFDPAPNAINTPDSLTRLRFVIAALPAFFYVVAWLGMRNYSIDLPPVRIGSRCQHLI